MNESDQHGGILRGDQALGGRLMQQREPAFAAREAVVVRLGTTKGTEPSRALALEAMHCVSKPDVSDLSSFLKLRPAGRGFRERCH